MVAVITWSNFAAYAEKLSLHVKWFCTLKVGQAGKMPGLSIPTCNSAAPTEALVWSPSRCAEKWPVTILCFVRSHIGGNETFCCGRYGWSCTGKAGPHFWTGNGPPAEQDSAAGRWGDTPDRQTGPVGVLGRTGRHAAPRSSFLTCV